MQLDRTQIAIRQRSTGELLDLALKVCAIYARPLLMWTALIAIPIMLLNELLLYSIVVDEISEYTVWTYLALMAQLVFLQGPVATMATTIFLGRMMFMQETNVDLVLKQLWAFFPRVIWTQLVLRCVLIGIVLAAVSVGEEAFMFMLGTVCVFVGIVRMARPYINEIVLLERNPLFSKNANVITVGRRSRALHNPSGGDLIGRWVITTPVVVAIMLSVSYSLWYAYGIFTNRWAWSGITVRLLVPLSMWLLVIYSTVLRFLSYLDLRIRREGWEVELKVQAAATELKGRLGG